MNDINYTSLEFVEDFSLTLESPYDVFSAIQAIGRYSCMRDREHSFLLLLNEKMMPISIHLIGIGSSSDVSMAVREYMRAITLSGACGFVLIHTHPCGLIQGLKPSLQDCNTVDRDIQMSKLTGITMVDSIIIGRENNTPVYFSMREKKLRNPSGRKAATEKVGEFRLNEETFPPLPAELADWEDNPLFLSHYTDEELQHLYPDKNLWDMER